MEPECNEGDVDSRRERGVMDGQGCGSEESWSSWALFKPEAKLDLGAAK